MPRAAVRAREAQDEETLVGMKRSRSDLDSSELDGSSGQDEHDLGGGAGSPGRSRRTEKQQQRARNKACREKSRREFLNDCFFLLADVVGTEPPLKDKGSILRGAIKEIRALREEGARMKQENERMHGLVQGKAAAAAHQEAELVQHRDFLPLWLDPSEFNEEFDNALRPPLA